MNVRYFDLLGELQDYIYKICISQDQFLAWNLTTKEGIKKNLGTASSIICTITSAQFLVFFGL